MTAPPTASVPHPEPAVAATPAGPRASDLTIVGEAWQVAAVSGDDDLAARLQSSGLWPGAPVELITRAPFGDPLLLRVHGFRLALRRSEAERVLLRRPEVRS